MNTPTPRWVAAFIALLTAVTALIVAIANNGEQIVNVYKQFHPSHAQVQQLTKAAVASPTPNPACNVPVGKGVMGACTPPRPPALVPLLGAPRTIHGILGVDTSSYQHCADLSNVSFGIFKLNESAGYRDAYAGCNVRSARARHIGNGGYDFLRPGRTLASVECKVFVAQFKAVGVQGPAVADVEATILGRAGTQAYVRSWVGCVHVRLPGVTIIIYTGAWFWTPQVGGPGGTSNLWISAYGNVFFIPAGFRSALIWQFNDGRVGPYPRIHGYDTDVFLGSRARFNATFNASKPISRRAREDCAGLNRYRIHTQLLKKRHKRPARGATALAQRRKRALTKAHYKCTLKGGISR